MLVLSRKIGESIVIDGDVTVTVVDIQRDKVRLGINAPKSVAVHRQEVFDAIHAPVGTPPSAPTQTMAKPTVAIIGASTDRRKFGNKSVRAHLAAGFEVFPVHPTVTEIEGLRVYQNARSIPVALDRVSMYLPTAIALPVLEELALVRPGEVWLNPGADAPEIIARARALGLHFIPACSIVALGLSPGQFGD